MTNGGKRIALRRTIDISVNYLNAKFNGMSLKGRKMILLAFGVLTASVCVLMITNGLMGHFSKDQTSIQKITQPKDIYMTKENKMDADHLIPVGKYKGEINGSFEGFYLAVDSIGNTYINRSPDYSKDLYLKSNGWEEITKQQLSEYKKHLHFIPKKRHELKP